MYLDACRWGLTLQTYVQLTMLDQHTRPQVPFRCLVLTLLTFSSNEGYMIARKGALTEKAFLGLQCCLAFSVLGQGLCSCSSLRSNLQCPHPPASSQEIAVMPL